MTTAPSVELRFNPTDLRPRDLPKAGAYLGSPADAIEAALAVARAAMVRQMRAEVRGLANPTHSQILRLADLAWQAVFWRYRKLSAPIMADAYIAAYRRANAGDVPMSVIYELADKHAEKIGDYFHDTSRQGLADGFNTLVNRRLPARAAADRVLDAYGLTPRQMRTYTAAKQFDTPVTDVMPRGVKAKARAYIDKAFTQRSRKLARQEEHNIEEQAKQFAWMWLQDKGKLNQKAEKVWITAKDERVCPVCGPLHGQKVGIGEQFTTREGKFWTPGLHPNCRCMVRLIENTFSKADWDPKEHPRGYHGRFGTATRTKTLDVDTEFERLTQGVTAPVAADPQLDLKFAEIMHHGILPRTKARVVTPRAKTYALVRTPVEAPVRAPAAVEAPVEAPVKTPVRAPAKPKLKRITELKTDPTGKIKEFRTRYVVVDSNDFDPEKLNQFELNPGGDSTLNRAQAERVRLERGRWSGTGCLRRHLLGPRRAGSSRTVREYELLPDQTHELVSHYARLAMQKDPLSPSSMDIKHPTFNVQAIDSDGKVLRDESGNRIMESMTAEEVGKIVGLDRMTFGSRIVAINEKWGHEAKPSDLPLDPTIGAPGVDFDGIFRARPGSGSAKSQHHEFNAPILEAKPSFKKRD